MVKKLEAGDIERIVEKERGSFDWGRHVDWLNKPEMPFLKPTILKNGAVIWPFCQIHPNAKIGKLVVIGCFTNICGPVEVGDETRMQGFVFIPEGVTIGKRVYVGPGVIFTNVKYPTARHGKRSRDRLYEKVVVGEKSALGAGSIICPGVTIGPGALVAAGSVVTSDVMAEWLVKGNPARHIKRIVDLKAEPADKYSVEEFAEGE